MGLDGGAPWVAQLILNTDFNMSTMTAQELNAAVAAWQKGAISRDTLFELLRRGEILPEGRSNEEEARLVGAAKPVEPASDKSARNFI